VPAAKFVEVCGKLPAGARVASVIDATGPLNFNIHFHEGKKVIFPAKQDGVAKSDGALDVKVDQDYCWMWSSKALQAATLKLQLERGRSPPDHSVLARSESGTAMARAPMAWLTRDRRGAGFKCRDDGAVGTVVTMTAVHQVLQR